MTNFFSFSSSLSFLVLSRNRLPRVAFDFPFLEFEKLSGAFSRSLISIAFDLIKSRTFAKENPRRLSLNRIAGKEPQVFSLQWTLTSPE